MKKLISTPSRKDTLYEIIKSLLGSELDKFRLNSTPGFFIEYERVFCHRSSADPQKPGVWAAMIIVMVTKESAQLAIVSNKSVSSTLYVSSNKISYSLGDPDLKEKLLDSLRKAIFGIIKGMELSMVNVRHVEKLTYTKKAILPEEYGHLK